MKVIKFILISLLYLTSINLAQACTHDNLLQLTFQNSSSSYIKIVSSEACSCYSGIQPSGSSILLPPSTPSQPYPNSVDVGEYQTQGCSNGSNFNVKYYLLQTDKDGKGMLAVGTYEFVYNLDPAKSWFTAIYTDTGLTTVKGTQSNTTCRNKNPTDCNANSHIKDTLTLSDR